MNELSLKLVGAECSFQVGGIIAAEVPPPNVVVNAKIAVLTVMLKCFIQKGNNEFKRGGK